jgi:hypothetical protein
MALNHPRKSNRCLAVMVRHPEPGKVKTRLAKAYGDAFAAELYGYFVDDLLQALAPGNFRLEIFFTPIEKDPDIRRRFGDQFSYTPQQGEGLGERMENVFRCCFARRFAVALLIGSDFPDLTANLIEEGFLALENRHDAVVGPAFDGGYYLIGFRSAAFDPDVFREMSWGENAVFDKTVNRLHARGCRIHLAPAWHDIDTEKDLANLQARHGNTAFSRSRTMTFLRDRRGRRPDGISGGNEITS